MFKVESVGEGWRAAVQQDLTRKSVHEIIRHALTGSRDGCNTLGEPEGSCMQTIYRSDDLSPFSTPSGRTASPFCPTRTTYWP